MASGRDAHAVCCVPCGARHFPGRFRARAVSRPAYLNFGRNSVFSLFSHENHVLSRQIEVSRPGISRALEIRRKRAACLPNEVSGSDRARRWPPHAMRAQFGAFRAARGTFPADSGPGLCPARRTSISRENTSFLTKITFFLAKLRLVARGIFGA